jgi:hypothetical protein
MTAEFKNEQTLDQIRPNRAALIESLLVFKFGEPVSKAPADRVSAYAAALESQSTDFLRCALIECRKEAEAAAAKAEKFPARKNGKRKK